MSGIYIGGYSIDYEGDHTCAVGVHLGSVKKETLGEVKRLMSRYGFVDSIWIHRWSLEGLASLQARLTYDHKARKWTEELFDTPALPDQETKRHE